MAEGESGDELNKRRTRGLSGAGAALLGVLLGGVIGLAGTVWSTQAQIRHAERSQLRAERITAYHDYLVAHERVLGTLGELRELESAWREESDPAQREALITEYEELKAQAGGDQFDLTVAADKLYVVGSPKAGSAAVDLIEALGAVTAASINEGDHAPDELKRAEMTHHIAVSNFNSVAREDVGTAPAGPGPGLSTRLPVGGIVTIAASVLLAVLLVVSLLRWKRSGGS